MTRGKYNENDNEDCSVGKSFGDDPFGCFGKPGGIDVSICSSESSDDVNVGYGELERLVLGVPGRSVPPGTRHVIVKCDRFWQTYDDADQIHEASPMHMPYSTIRLYEQGTSLS